MSALILVPIFLQGLVIAIDEFYFHWRRGLPKWERLGHPLDTLSLLGPLILSLSLAPTIQNIEIYAGLSILSCLFVTKDEWVHVSVCGPAEQWLHSLLFVLHPVVLYSFYLCWIQNAYHVILVLQCALITTFMFYQLIFWQFRKHAKN